MNAVENSSQSAAALRMSAIEFRWPGATEHALALPALELHAGERVFMAGPSGSGKSTLLGLIAGTLKSDSGHVEIAGLRADSLSARRRDRLRADHIGVIFQQFNLLPFLSARDNVELVARFSKRRADRAIARDGSVRAQAQRLLGELGISDAQMLRPAAQLSVGQQQRVAAARALFGAPELILADEPTSALDAHLRDEFVRLLLGECAGAGSALLFVSHDEGLRSHFDRSLRLAPPHVEAA